jgi:hypothetical protein
MLWFKEMVLLNGALLDLSFEVRGPGMLYQHPEDERCRHCKASVIKEPYGDEAKDERVSRAPEPYVLVQNVKSDNAGYK